MIEQGMTAPGVLLVGNFLSGAGGRRAVCEDLADRLAQVGWNVSRTSARQNRARKLADMLATTWRRRHLYSIAQVDLFSGKAFLWAEAVCLLLRWLGRPYVLTLHGGDLPRYAQSWPSRVSRLLNSAAAVTAPSEYLRRELLPFRPDLQTIPNALALDAYPFRIRAGTVPRLIWVRSFHEMYNPVMAIEVAHLLRQRCPSMHLTMVGPDRGDGSLDRSRRRIRDLGLDTHVRIEPGVPKSRLPGLLAQADIFLNTASIDNAPVSLLEAMACGLCVVTTDPGGIRDLVSDGADALLVRPGDRQAMCEAVERLLSDPVLCMRLSAAARAFAGRVDWQAILPRWTALLASVAERHSSALGPGSRPRSGSAKVVPVR